MRLILYILAWGTVSVVAASLNVAQVVAMDGASVSVDVGKRFTLQSEILGEERQILVRLPQNYDESGAGYPVIYLLDGDRHFAHASLGADVLERTERMPASIIVALPNNPGTRGRDLAREMENFRRFIGEELFAFIDSKYHVSGNRTLFGHSLAGYFTLSVLADQPDMFDNYIAASPAVHARRGEVVGKFDRLFSENKIKPKSVFFTLTEAAEEGQDATDTLNRMVTLFEKSAPDAFKWRYDFVSNHVHMTTPFLTVYQGLSHVFSDYQAPRYISTKAYTEAGGMEALGAFFNQRTEKYGVEKGIPQASIRQIAYLYSDEETHDQAIMLFKENVQKFPETPRVYNSLGDGYTAAGQLGLAQEAYERAVSLAEEQDNEDVDWFRRNLQRLKTRMAQE